MIIPQMSLIYKGFSKFYKYVDFAADFLLDYPNKKDFFCYNRRFWRSCLAKLQNTVVIAAQNVYNSYGVEWTRFIFAHHSD